ncbi:MAG: aldo/keto reductase [Defluviitaleaceae bacterium]|nr:aldo/keto reductase [Defluviitaleaceae bacterium]
MIKRPFGKTGVNISALGFGAMRLPTMPNPDHNPDDKDSKQNIINDELAIPLMHKAFELGVNYIDTAIYYVDGLSEISVGKAVKSWHANGGNQIYVATKNPVPGDPADDLPKVWWERFETSLRKLDLPHIDFYHMWSLNLESYQKGVLYKEGPLALALKAKEQGLIKHISFSWHGKTEDMKILIDSGHFESVLLQYNLLDRSNEENIERAYDKGLGVVVMGPVAGGRLGEPSPVIQKVLGGNKKASTAEMAMRFVLANPKVHVSLSGMENIGQVVENAAVAGIEGGLTADEVSKIHIMLEENKKLMDLYCTGCNYCLPCPANINIPRVFTYMNYHKVYGLTDYAKREFAKIGNESWGPKYAKVSECVECGVCSEKCPQNIDIIKQLKETEAALS